MQNMCQIKATTLTAVSLGFQRVVPLVTLTLSRTKWVNARQIALDLVMYLLALKFNREIKVVL